MSDSDESGVTYTEVSSPFEDLSDVGSPKANDYEYLELPGMPEDPYMETTLQAPPSPDYVPGPEEPEQAPPSPDYVPGPEHADDEIVAEDLPYAEDASPTAQSPDYVPESDPEADPEEDDDEDLEEDPVDYPADGGDDNDDEGGHQRMMRMMTWTLRPMMRRRRSTQLLPTLISIPAPVPTPVWSDAEIPSPSLPLSPPSLVLSPAPPPSPIRSLGYQAAMIRMRAEAASTSYSLPLPPPFILSPTRSDAPSLGIPPPLPISVPTSSPPLLLPSASRREDRPEVTLPPQKRLGIALGPRYEVGESSSAAVARPDGGLRADYGFVATMDREIRRDPKREVRYRIADSWDEIVETLQGAPVSTDTELGRHITAFEARVRQDTDEIYTRRQAVTSEMLKADHRRSAEMRELRITDRTRQQQLIHTLTVMQSLQREVTLLQGQVTTLQGQGPAGGPTQPELPEEAGSSS
ncbi:hypothetical protein Tco_0717402 [Tanacetum coccineum]